MQDQRVNRRPGMVSSSTSDDRVYGGQVGQHADDRHNGQYERLKEGAGGCVWRVLQTRYVL